MTVEEMIELLRRFPCNANIGMSASDDDLPTIRRIEVFTIKHRYGGKWRWPLNTPDAELPDWSKPDPVTQ